MANLRDKKIIYTFDTWEDWDDLMQHLENEGVTWISGKNPTAKYVLDKNDYSLVLWVKSEEPTESYPSEDTPYAADEIAVRLEEGMLSWAPKDSYHNFLPDKNYEKVHWKKREKKDKTIIYTFDTWEDYDDLMEHLEDEGVRWLGGDKPTELQGLKDGWEDAKEVAVELVGETLIFVTKDLLRFCSLDSSHEEIHWEWSFSEDVYYDASQVALRLAEGTLSGANKDLYRDFLSDKNYEKVHWKKGMKKDKKIIYTFDTWEDYNNLMQYLEGKGVMWNNGCKPTEREEFNKIYYNINYDPQRLVIFLRHGELTHANKDWLRDFSASAYGDYEKVHWKKKKDVSLAEFLGWEEDVEYRRKGKIYKVEGEHLMILKNDSHWKNVCTKTWELVDLRNARKYKPKYYAKIIGWELLASDSSYFRWSIKFQTMSLGSNSRTIEDKHILDVVCCMTKEEWEKLGVNEDNAVFFEVK